VAVQGLDPIPGLGSHRESGGGIGVCRGQVAADQGDAGQGGGGHAGVRVDDVLPALGGAGGGDGEVAARDDEREGRELERMGDANPPRLTGAGLPCALHVAAAVDAVGRRSGGAEHRGGPLDGPALHETRGIKPAAGRCGEVPAA
jgi:hypothetical protein